MGTRTGRRRAVSAAGLLCASALAAAAQTAAPPHVAKPATPPSAQAKPAMPAQAQAKTAMPQAKTAMLQAKTFTYTILRNGSPIGKHTMAITPEAGGSTTIDEATDIEVKVVFVTAYKMHTTSHEVWTADKFATFSSQTDDNGKKHKVDANVDAKGLVNVTTEAGHNSMPVGTLPSSFWTEQMMTGRKSFFDPETGAPQDLVITAVGKEPLAVNGQRVETMHYHVAGTIERDVWFVNGAPVRFQLKGSDGSTITSELVPESAVR